MKIGVAIDPWKLDIFLKVLDDSGFMYKVAPGKMLTVITVTTDNPIVLANVVQGANNLCDTAKKKKAKLH